MNASNETMALANWPRWLFLAAVALTCLLYWPGLGGGYVLDDYPNLVENSALHVTDMKPASWTAAIWSSPASDMRRPLASLSFALNYASTGSAPWPMKAVNLLIHLVNGWLLFLLLGRLVAIADAATPSRDRMLPLVVAALWLVHPINLTAVLYVVQRMESMANLFVLGALILYVYARTRAQATRFRAIVALWIGVPLLTAVGALAKESAVLVPLYALLIEVTVLRTVPRAPLGRRGLTLFFALFLAVPGLLATAWLLSRYAVPQAYAMRPFTLVQRLLTEPRVLMDYVGWIVLPLPSSFSLYRDDYAISQSLVNPWTTLPAIAGLLAIAFAAVALRRKRPLISLGLALFLAAHVLTATVIPLELVYEHRNYFASSGILLALADIVLPAMRGAQWLPRARFATLGALLALCCLSTALRAREWSQPLRLAMLEAARHPESPRATYGLGRALLVESEYREDSPFLPRAKAALEDAAKVPNASILPESALVNLASRLDEPVEDRWLDNMVVKLTSRAPTMEDLSALRGLTDCITSNVCAISDANMLRIYLAAVAHDPPDSSALYSYAIIAYRRLHDVDLALQLARDAADRSPYDAQYRLNLVNFLIGLGRKSDAAAELDRLKRQDRVGRLSAGIADAETRLRELGPGVP